MATQENAYSDTDIESLATKLSHFAAGLTQSEQAALAVTLSRALPAGDDTQGFWDIPVPIIKHDQLTPAQVGPAVQSLLSIPSLTPLLRVVLTKPEVPR